MQISKILLSVFFTAFSLFTIAQDDASIREYINKYKDIAINEMKRSGVPAAITLAQGIHETDAGQSDLVKKSNNHFGIKCKSYWTGKSVSHDDDARGECFRKYDLPEQSYFDHSDFLKSSPRYASLFSLDPTDYEGWAKGLKSAGYATNPKYARILIKLVEDYNLQDYTLIALGKMKEKDEWLAKKEEKVFNDVSFEQPSLVKEGGNGPVAPSEVIQPDYPSGEFKINETRVIFISKGTSYLTIAGQYDIPLARLFEFNDMKPDEISDKDQLIFLQRKRKMGANDFHIVQPGETIFSISQKEAIRLESLLEFNSIGRNSMPAIGEKLYLRSKADMPPHMVDNNAIENQTYTSIQPENKSVSYPNKLTITKPKIIFHNVKPKETLYTIAMKYDVTLDDIADWNQLQKYNLKTGQQLKILKKGNDAIH